MQNLRHKTKRFVQILPSIKPHLDLIAGILTIPVLLTVIILNFSNLSQQHKSAELPVPTQSQSSEKAVTIIQVKPTSSPSASTASCQPTIGPLTISYPTEGQTVNTNPLCITIDYESEGYCAVVWAYQINNGPLSDYSNNSVCLYNMPSGKVNFQLDVKSLVSNQTKVFTRTFTYAGLTPTTAVTLTPTPTGSVSPTQASF